MSRLVEPQQLIRPQLVDSRNAALPHGSFNSENDSMEKLDYTMERVPCALCGSLRHEIYLRQAKELYNGLDAWFDVVRCRDCGHYFTNPRPTAETIACFYPDSARYYQPKSARADADKAVGSRLQRSVLASSFGYPFSRLPKIIEFPLCRWAGRRHLAAHVPRFVQGGRLLDIGCAWGGYLSRMRSLGWDVCGVELNDTAAAYARESLGLDVRTGTVERIDALEGTFDVVHMSMVLEHLYDPLGSLKSIGRILKGGGQLILSVPDLSGCEARFFGDKAYTLQVPQHLQHFTPTTITAFLEKTGFRVERIVHQRTKADIVKSAAYLERRWLNSLLNSALFKGLVLSPLTTLLAWCGKSSRMSVYAIKAVSTGGRS
ncbi:MAG: class I SAM-dependent methyltransferase [Desulfuromonadales bacterium]